MSNATQALLPLAPLHLPDKPGLFPLAWGWWLIIALVLISIVLLCYFLRNYYQKRRAQKVAIKAVKHCQSIREINILLKRAALSYFDRTTVAPLTAEAWLSFLDSPLATKQQGFVAMKTEWIQSSFSNQAENKENLLQAQKLALVWLKQALPPKKNHKEWENV